MLQNDPSFKKNKKLRLLLFEECRKKCSGCCNKQFDINSLPVETDFRHYAKIILTGGEPMLRPAHVWNVIKMIRLVNKCPIYVYTAKVDDVIRVSKTLDISDGLTLTLHEQNDIVDFIIFDSYITYFKKKYEHKSLRLNVFDGISIDPSRFPLWKIKMNIKWKDDYPLPENEIFCRLGEI